MKTKTMFVMMVIAGVVAIASCSKSTHKSEPVKKSTTTAKVIYTCPMDTDVVSDHPGKCPKCGMDLVKKEK
jgi:hypothetical protein